MPVKRARLLNAAFFILGAASSFLLATSQPAFLGRLEARAFAQSQTADPIKGKRNAGKVSPCGEIRATEIPFANAEGIFPDRELRLRQQKWFFESMTETGLAHFLNCCDLLPIEKQNLLDKGCWNVISNGIEVTPSEQLVWSLGHHARQQIYSVLAQSSANYSQCFPFRFSPDGFELNFRESGLQAEQLRQLRHLTYTNGAELCFADLRTAESVLKPAEFNDLLQALYVTPSYLLRLQVNPDSDVTALVKYWGKGGRERIIAPLISSLAKVPGGASINISYLLPPFARLRLYTYPEAWNDMTEAKQDCVFTSLNFFNETMNTNLFDLACREKYFNSEYAAIKDEPSFGDLVTLLDSENQAIHTCVYIADNFVFTKNGVSDAQPWILMKMSDMLGMYSSPQKFRRVVFLRRKETDKRPSAVVASPGGAHGVGQNAIVD
ncbi:MAG: hypothetical protein QOJ40_59 [Verrucomicrobiota bacterium]